MKLRKRGGIYWIDAVVDGIRIQRSLHTKDKRDATTRAHDIVSEAKQGKITTTSISFAKLPFGEAADKFIESKRLEVKPSTLVKNKQLLKKLREVFKTLRLNQITSEHVLAYRDWRAKQGVGPTIINMEVGLLQQILKRAKRWQFIADDIKRLKEPPTIGRALSPEQKLQLLHIASQRPEWQTAYWAAILALNTTMRAAEIRSLRWWDIDLFERILQVPESKTEAGLRPIPLTDAAYNTLLEIRRRNELFGPVETNHYVFPSFKTVAQFNGKEIVGNRYTAFNPEQPMTTWRRAWRSLTKKAGLKGLRFHDLRHHAITEMLENGVPEQMVMEIAGHVSLRMLKRYSHIRMSAKRSAVDCLNTSSITKPDAEFGLQNSQRDSYVTNHVTVEGDVPVYSDLNPLESTKEGIGACGFEPQTPTVSR